MRQALAALALLTLAPSLPGCFDDRETAREAIYTCNPASASASADCGDDHTCYDAAQVLGPSICLPRCDAAVPASCDGECTLAGECLPRCTVGAAQSQCAEGLSCIYRTYNPLEHGADDGVCMPVNAVCASDADCHSPVFNRCPFNIFSGSAGPSSARGSACFQGDCQAKGSACEPGSSCLRHVLPFGEGIPDFCVPDCVQATLPSGEVLDRCVVGFTCMSTAFPQQGLSVCAPGVPGWLCRESLGCLTGHCTAWGDHDPALSEFRTCTPSCVTDDDCLPYDTTNPTMETRFTCQNGACRSLQSLGFTSGCFAPGEPCRLDPQAECVMLATNVLACLRFCASEADCATLSAATHVPHACTGADGQGVCAPQLPVVRSCANAGSCPSGLGCEDLPGGGKGCTVHCQATADCNAVPTLGSSFACELGLCLPKTPSGFSPPAPIAELCMSGMYDTTLMRCLSPSGWACDGDTQCQSAVCVLDAIPRPGSVGRSGHCQ